MSNIKKKTLYLRCDSLVDQIDLHYHLNSLFKDKDIEVTFDECYVIIEVGAKENLKEIMGILTEAGYKIKMKPLSLSMEEEENIFLEIEKILKKINLIEEACEKLEENFGQIKTGGENYQVRLMELKRELKRNIEKLNNLV